jgi:hypothetical protein
MLPFLDGASISNLHYVVGNYNTFSSLLLIPRDQGLTLLQHPITLSLYINLIGLIRLGLQSQCRKMGA